MRQALIDVTTDTVVNIIEWDEISNWSPPSGVYLVETADANIGDSYDKANCLFSSLPAILPPPTMRDFVMAVQVVLDAKAQERGYDGILSACTYADDTNSKFAAEGAACKAWRSAVWAQCYADLAAVQAGTMAQPTVAAFIASLPQLTWPS